MTRTIKRLIYDIYRRLLGGCVELEVLRITHGSHYFFGNNPLRIAPTACVHNALFNTMSGSVTIEDNVSFGHNVCVLTGTHDLSLQNKQRQEAWPKEGRDVVVRRGAWVSSNATILGPCVIGENAVVAAGAVVTCDVPPNTLVGGVPARIIRDL